MHRLKLSTGGATTDIRVGSGLSKDLHQLDRKPLLLIDEHVLCEHDDVFGSFESIAIPAGEKYKTLQTVERIYRELVMAGVDRSSLLLGVGGGLATDVAGFVASTYLRGLPFGFISSTLLGQVDASIGGKNGVNIDGYKNMVGNIRQPDFVWCDLDLLKTLARKEYISGIAEVIKYGAILDAEFLVFLDQSMAGLLDQDPVILEEVVSRSVLAKARVVEQDEKENDLRRILNFGHTIGHALERDLKILHGYAVSVGMHMAAQISMKMSLLKEEEAAFLKDILLSAGLPVELGLNADRIYENLTRDKKKSGDEINFVLLEGLGRSVVRPISLNELKRILHDMC